MTIISILGFEDLIKKTRLTLRTIELRRSDLSTVSRDAKPLFFTIVLEKTSNQLKAELMNLFDHRFRVMRSSKQHRHPRDLNLRFSSPTAWSARGT